MVKQLLIILFTLLTLSVSAQTVKEITVSATDSYTDNIALKRDAKDMDIMVKFVFDEKANTLTVSLISYRGLFVFREQAGWKQIMKGKKLMPDKLPYMAEADAKAKFKVTKSVRDSLPKPYKKYVFKRWIDVQGLQAVPTDYKMVNAFIEQKFDIPDKGSYVRVRLRDILIMEPAGIRDYQFIFCKDLNTEYNITIQRDPCFAMDKEIASAKGALQGIKEAYTKFASQYKNGMQVNAEEAKAFKSVHDVLTKQFTRVDSTYSCPELQNTWNEYNKYVAKIHATKTVRKKSSGGGESGPANPIIRKFAKGFDVTNFRMRVQRIDALISRWLQTKDPTERDDLNGQIKRTIGNCERTIKTLGAVTPEQKKAVEQYRKALKYYNSVCK